MKSFIRNLLPSFSNSPKSGRSLAHKNRAHLGVESLEGREMMTAAPMTPTFTATGINASQIKLTWNAVSGATGYQLDYSVNGSAWAKLNTTITGSQTSLTLNCSDGALYRFDLCAYNSAGYSGWANEQQASTWYNPAASQIANPPAGFAAPTYSTAYSNVPLFGPSGVPSAFDVQQGNAGDCWLLSSLAEVAAKAPQDIEKMFTYDGTTVENGAIVGLYTVHFFNQNNVPVSVTVDTEFAVGGYGGMFYDRAQNPDTGSPVLWVALAEKAYAEANGLGYVKATYSGDSYAALYSGQPQWALQAITGQSASCYSVSSTIAGYAADNYIIVLTSSSKPAAGIVPTHAYALVGYSNGYFDVLNPWGTTSTGAIPSDDAGNYVGYCQLTLAQLEQNFGQETIGAAAIDVRNFVANPSTGIPASPTIATNQPASTIVGNPYENLPSTPVASPHHSVGWETPATQWHTHLSADLDQLFFDADNLTALRA